MLNTKNISPFSYQKFFARSLPSPTISSLPCYISPNRRLCAISVSVDPLFALSLRLDVMASYMFFSHAPLAPWPINLKILPYRILFSYCRTQPSVPHSTASFFGVILQNCGRLFYLINSGCSLILLFPRVLYPSPSLLFLAICNCGLCRRHPGSQLVFWRS